MSEKRRISTKQSSSRATTTSSSSSGTSAFSSKAMGSADSPIDTALKASKMDVGASKRSPKSSSSSKKSSSSSRSPSDEGDREEEEDLEIRCVDVFRSMLADIIWLFKIVLLFTTITFCGGFFEKIFEWFLACVLGVQEFPCRSDVSPFTMRYVLDDDVYSESLFAVDYGHFVFSVRFLGVLTVIAIFLSPIIFPGFYLYFFPWLKHLNCCRRCRQRVIKHKRGRQ